MTCDIDCEDGFKKRADGCQSCDCGEYKLESKDLPRTYRHVSLMQQNDTMLSNCRVSEYGVH